MKKKLLTILALFSALAMIAGFSACADETVKKPQSGEEEQGEPSGGEKPGEEEPGGQEKEPQDISDSLVFTKNAEGTAYAVADLSDMQTEGYVVIPESYEGLPVTEIGEAAFGDCRYLTGVTLPETVTKIGNNAFYNCESLEALAFPKGLQQVGEYLVKGCVSLSSITVEEGCEAYFAEGNCLVESETKTLVAGCAASEIPPLKVQTVAEGAFADQRGLEKIYFPAGVSKIGRYAFLGCSGLKEIQFAGDMREIGDGAFSDCRSLTKFSLPYKVDQLGDGVLAGCDALAQILVSSNNTRFLSEGNCIIERASGILKAGCPTSVIPSDGKVTSVGYFAFGNCRGLKELTLPASVTQIDGFAFQGCVDLERVVLPQNLDKIGDGAFNQCSSLTGIVIPASVREIGIRVFNGCPLTSIQVEEGNAVYHSAGNCLIRTQERVLVEGCSQSVIPSDGSVTIIGPYAFSECDGLKHIDIPSPVKSVGLSAFSLCRNLVSVTLPESLELITYTAFGHCDSLSQVTFAQTEGWVCAPWNGGESTAVDVSDPAKNASLLSDELKDRNWSRA